MKRPCYLFAALIVLFSTMTAQAGVASLIDVIPSEAPVMVYLTNVPDLVAAGRHSPLAELWRDPQVKHFFAPLRDQLRLDEWEELVESETGLQVGELTALFTGEAVFFVPDSAAALTAVEDQRNGWPPLVLLVEIGEHAGEIEQLIHRRLTEREGDVSSTSRAFADVEIHTVTMASDPSTAPPLGWAVFDGLLVLATSPPLVESIITDVGRGGSAEPLGSSEIFLSAQPFIRANDLQLFLDLSLLAPQLRAAVANSPAGAQPSMIPVDPLAIFDALALDALRAGFAGATLGAEGLEVDAGITFTGNRGLIRLLSYGPGEAPRPDFIPAEAPAFGTARFDMQGTWRAIEEIMTAVNPALLAMASAQVTAMIQNAGVELDLRRDLLENLGQDVVMIQSKPSLIETEGGGSPVVSQSQVVVVSIEQRQSFELALETLKTMAGQGSQLFSEREYLGTTIYTLDVPQSAGGIAYAVTEDHFLLSFGSPQSLESALVAMRQRGRTAWRTEPVERALARLEGGAAALSYQDLGVTGLSLFQVLARLASVEPEGLGSVCDPAAVPDQETIAKYLGPAISGVYKNDNSLVVRTRVLPAQGASR